MGCYFLLHGLFPTQGLNPNLPCLLHCWQTLICWAIRTSLCHVNACNKDHSAVRSPSLGAVSQWLTQYPVWNERAVLCLVTRSSSTLWDPMDGSPPGSREEILNSPGKNTGVGCHALLQIFTTQGSNPGLPHYRWILYHLNCICLTNNEKNYYTLKTWAFFIKKYVLAVKYTWMALKVDTFNAL